MKQTTGMHRPTAVIAAVLMIFAQVLNISATFASSITYTPAFLLELFGNTLITIGLSVILFRGRKDTVAGVVFLLAIIGPVVSVAWNMLVVAVNTEQVDYAAVCILCGLLLAAFRGLAAGECLSEGKVSAGGARMLLWVLPILCFCADLWARTLLSRHNGVSPGQAVAESLAYTIPNWIGPILMGISLSVRKMK